MKVEIKSWLIGLALGLCGKPITFTGISMLLGWLAGRKLAGRRVSTSPTAVTNSAALGYAQLGHIKLGG